MRILAELYQMLEKVETYVNVYDTICIKKILFS